MNPIKRKVDVEITPSVGEVADIIWDMDAQEQAFLLQQLASHFNNAKGLLQLSCVLDEVIIRGNLGLTDVSEVGNFGYYLCEYFGPEAIRERMNELKRKEVTTDESTDSEV